MRFSPKQGSRLRSVFPAVPSKDAATLKGKRLTVQRKRDGYRALFRLEDDIVEIVSSEGNVLFGFRPLRQSVLSALRVWQPAMLDGEIVHVSRNGIDDLAGVKFRTEPLHFTIFDMLALGGQDIGTLPLHLRLTYLEQVLSDVSPDGCVSLVPQLEGDPVDAAKREIDGGHEGVVIKDLDSVYEDGPLPTPSWVKVKRIYTKQELALRNALFGQR